MKMWFNNLQFQDFFLLILHALFFWQLLQRFCVEYYQDPLEMRHKLLTAPEKPVKINLPTASENQGHRCVPKG